MRHEDAALALLIVADETARERAVDCRRAEHLAQAAPEHSVRRRVGEAVIALGERLAGDSRPVSRRRLAGHAS
jgi:hypothetical protein